MSNLAAAAGAVGPHSPILAGQTQPDLHTISPMVCYYCGEPAESTDHVVPQAILKSLRILDDEEVTRELVRRNRILMVDCCLDCNSRLGAIYSSNLEARRQVLKYKLRRKYRRLLAMPDWDDSDLGRLGPGLQEFVLIRLVKRDRIRRRLAYMGAATLNGNRLAQ